LPVRTASRTISQTESAGLPQGTLSPLSLR
jgi:hypothetical protein